VNTATKMPPRVRLSISLLPDGVAAPQPHGMHVAGAAKNSGWHAGTEVDVVNDGAKGMRSLVTDVIPNVATPMLDWFHLAMKLQAVPTSLFASTFE
jgi:hypothetical protein